MNCDGDDPSVTQCVIPMSALTVDPFYLEFDSLVVARVTAINAYGSSTPSVINTDGARVRRIPDKMAAVTYSDLREDQVTLSWTILTGESTGNSDITSYKLMYDNSQPSIDFVLIDDLVTTFTATGLIGGSLYRFQVSACNVYGCGLASDPVQINASDVPG